MTYSAEIEFERLMNSRAFGTREPLLYRMGNAYCWTHVFVDRSTLKIFISGKATAATPDGTITRRHDRWHSLNTSSRTARRRGRNCG